MASRFDKYLREDKTKKENFDTVASTDDKPWQSKIFLILSFVMIAMAVLVYLLESSLLWLSQSSTTYMFLLGFFVLGALFFLSAYRMPKIGLWLMGRVVDMKEDPQAKVKGTRFNIFEGESGSEVALHQSKVKSARRARKKYGKGQKINEVKPLEDNDKSDET